MSYLCFFLVSISCHKSFSCTPEDGKASINNIDILLVSVTISPIIPYTLFQSPNGPVMKWLWDTEMFKMEVLVGEGYPACKLLGPSQVANSPGGNLPRGRVHRKAKRVEKKDTDENVRYLDN